MAKNKAVKAVPTPMNGETRKQIEETAYYSFLNRECYALPGDEMNDWISAEKEVKEHASTGL
jgi:hypothetical protein